MAQEHVLAQLNNSNELLDLHVLQVLVRYMTDCHDDMGCSRIRYLHEWHSWGLRDLAFKRYTGQQKALARMVANITAKAGRNTLVGFGNWSARDSAGIIKKHPCTPAKKLLRALRSKCTVVMVDEYKTSKLCAQCGATTCNMTTRGPDGVGQSKRVHAVLFCTNRSCAVRVNRDCNAARNILALLIAMLKGDRPKRFRRQGCG